MNCEELFGVFRSKVTVKSQSFSSCEMIRPQISQEADAKPVVATRLRHLYDDGLVAEIVDLLAGHRSKTVAARLDSRVLSAARDNLAEFRNKKAAAPAAPVVCD